MTGVCFLPRLQASDISQTDVCEGSPQLVYDWINRQGDDTRITRRKPIAKFFPQGPHEETREMVDIVIVTPDSKSSRPDPTHSLIGHSTVTEASLGVMGVLEYHKGEYLF